MKIIKMPVPLSFNGSTKSSDTPNSTRPPSYTSDRLPRYSFDGAPQPITAPAAAAALRIPLTAIAETPEIEAEKKENIALSIGMGALILIFVIMDGIVFGCTWFIMAIKLRPWNYSWWAEHREKYLLGLWIPSVLLAFFSGLGALYAAAAIRREGVWKHNCFARFFLILVFLGFPLAPFIGSFAIPMATRVNYFRHVCDGMDTRIEIDANSTPPFPLVKTIQTH
jgi:hypothetical protein